MPQFQAELPSSVHMDVLYDRSDTIRESYRDVQFTMLLTLGLVIMVIFVFLRNVWATVIPSLALPFSIIGTFAVMYMLDYSLDNLSMMALILSVAAIVIEPVLGEGGQFSPRGRGPTSRVPRSGDATGILFVADEVQSGFARTGRMFAVEHADVVPDIIVMAKGIASGFPIAGIGASAELMGQWPQGAHGGTYGGNPIGCAAALATIDVIESEHLADNARTAAVSSSARSRTAGRRLRDRRRARPGPHGRHRAGRPRRRPAAPAPAILRHCLDESHVIFMNCGTGGNVLRWMPPLVVSADEIDRGRRLRRRVEGHRL